MQTLLLEPHDADPFVVLKATGELDISTQDEFEDVVGRLLGSSSVVIDLSDLEFLAISALRSLMVCHARAVTSGHRIFYAKPSPQARRLLSVSGLDAVLPVTASVAQVVSTSVPVGGPVDQSGHALPRLEIA